MASKINKGEILAKFFDDGEYTALFADGAVSAACGYAAGQQAYAVYQNGEAVTVKDVEKNIKVLEMAAQTGCPVVTFYNSVGAKLAEGLDVLTANAKLNAQIAKVSGVIPQVAVVLGVCGGTSALSAANADVCIMAEGAELFFTAPFTSAAKGDKVADAGSAAAAAKAGVASIVAADAAEALAQTVNQNPVLQKAGVVDAGGKGWLYVLEAMLSVHRGVEIEAPEADSRPQEVREQADFTEFDTGEITFAFDTVYIMRKAHEDIDLSPLRAYLDTIGDSIVIGEDDESFKVHVHTNIPGEALTESQKYGTLELAKIENMQMQHDDLAAGRAARSTDDLEKIEQELEAKETVAAPEKHFGMVAVCAGKGLAGVFRELGADQIIEGGQTMNPSTQDILEKINATPAEVVFVFPNNKNIIMAAEQTAGLTEKKVVVVPSKTVPQGVSAMLVFDPDASEEDNLSAMTDAMAGVTTMQITYAARDSDIDGHNIHAGEYLALWGSSLFGSSADLKGLLRSMAEKVHEEGHEFVTVYAGADLPAGQAEEAAALFREVCPECEVTLIDGGQPVYYYLISAE